MSINKKHKELLEKLFNGVISDHEKWQLEKASLDDPFLADAIEGFYDNKFDAEVVENLKVEKPQVAVRRIPMWKPLSIAASFLMLMSISFWFYNNHLDSDTLMSTAAESQKSINGMTSNDEIVADMDALENAETETILVIDDSQEIFDQNSNGAERKNKYIPPNKNSNKEQNPPAPAPAPTTPVDVNGNLIVEEETIKENPDPAKLRELGAYEKSKVVAEAENTIIQEDAEVVEESYKVLGKRKVIKNAPEIESHIVKGYVYSKTGEPISYAKVFAENSKENVRTDADGSFVLNVSNMNQSIKAIHADYDPQVTYLAPEVSFNLVEVQNTFSQASKSLVEMMNENELRTEYTKILDRHFRSEWKMCSNLDDTNLRKTRIEFVISEMGHLDSLRFLDNLSTKCKEELNNHILKAFSENLFQGTVKTSFIYTYRF